ncbi:MAG: heparan-alpha-glucosaminide N-acetyltransferase domain-containing protein [Luteolibacter sp.]
MSESVSPARKPRLKFIDLARSIAILLMLEGHFVGLTLAKESVDTSHPIYVVWNSIRGFTAPLFFTVAGMIFVYLLSGEKERVFFKGVRVRKGLWRAGELLFWGYALQFSILNVGKYLRGEFGTWTSAFHVLQCIGVGLVVLILIAGLRRLVGKLPLTLWYGMAVVLCLGFYLWLKSLPEGSYVPEGWPMVFQNPIRGVYSVFPVAPWLAFTFLGGAMGAYVRSINHKPVTQKSCLCFFVLGAGLMVVWVLVPQVGLSNSSRSALTWFTERSTEVVVFLGILRWIEIRFGIGIEWMLKVGRETFAIYIVHVMVLYSGIIGIGVKNFYKGNLNGWQAAGGALLFMAVFVAFALFWNGWKMRRKAAKDLLKG